MVLLLEELRNYCLDKQEVTEGFPFDDKILVFKVCNKMFVLVDVENYSFINVKCNPERAIRLREKYYDISPGYHMSKKHWNSVRIDGDLSKTKIIELIDHSYACVVETLPLKLKKNIFR